MSYRTYAKWKGWEELEFGQCSQESALYFSTELARAGLANVRGCRILEIGFGNGEFAGWSIRNGARWSGTEAIPELVAVARQVGWDAYDSDMQIADLVGNEVFDLVICFDVFEHLELGPLTALLVSLRDVLAPQGRIIGRVPSGDSPFSGPIQHGDLTHQLAFGSSAVRQIGQYAGLKVMSIQEPAFPVFGLGWRSAVRRMMVKGLRAALFPLIRTVFIGNARAVLSPNMVFVLGRDS